MKKSKEPKITFHNPNTLEETVAVLSQIAAELAKTKVADLITNLKADT